MAQFAVHKNKNPRTRSIFPFLVDVQSDPLDPLNTRVVIPLSKAVALAKKPVSNLMPVLTFDGEDYVLVTPQLAGVARSDLGAQAGSLLDERAKIIAAIDFLLMGI